MFTGDEYSTLHFQVHPYEIVHQSILLSSWYNEAVLCRGGVLLSLQVSEVSIITVKHTKIPLNLRVRLRYTVQNTVRVGSNQPDSVLKLSRDSLSTLYYITRVLHYQSLW